MSRVKSNGDASNNGLFMAGEVGLGIGVAALTVAGGVKGFKSASSALEKRGERVIQEKTKRKITQEAERLAKRTPEQVIKDTEAAEAVVTAKNNKNQAFSDKLAKERIEDGGYLDPVGQTQFDTNRLKVEKSRENFNNAQKNTREL